MSRQLHDVSKNHVYRIVVESKLAFRGRGLQKQLQNFGINSPTPPKVSDLYFLEGNLTQQQIDILSETLICDPVTQSCNWSILDQDRRTSSFKNDGSTIIEVTLRPGVTDNTAGELLQAAERMGINDLKAAITGTRYELNSNLTEKEVHQVAKMFLVNDTIQRYSLGDISPEFMHPSEGSTIAELVPITTLNSSELEAVSIDRRLALDQVEMQAIQAYFHKENREPTDAELETLAQTWSEHCVHKTFKAKVYLSDDTEIDSLIKTYLQAATKKINAPWVRSAFVDNAGVIAFDDEFDISFKVETHNHPSAIEPFGGANTGVGGVVRDILGVSHRPIANTNILCFGPLEQQTAKLPEGVLHPKRIMDGVVHGIEDYGNKLGIPTVNGAILYHHGYTANPLVYCGCVGIGPKDSHPRNPQDGDHVIVLGGKTGRDGIRGATFSSLTMDGQTGEVAGASVQIGDPITEKGVIEVLERARDLKLYNAVTDCGAGGLSSAVGEMAEHLGAKVNLAKTPLKYPGLLPWEIWLSEAQERIVMAVPPHNIQALQDICDTFWVELSDIGEFKESGRLQVSFNGNSIVDLDNDFLHRGIPTAIRKAVIGSPAQKPNLDTEDTDDPIYNENEMLLALLSHPNIASKEDVIRRYDHEVRGATVVKPLVGIMHDGPSDASVIKPANTRGLRGFALANGINPFIGEYDSYNMAVSAVDEAVRNIVAVGGDPDQTAILDNFCWGDPRRPETMGGLVEAARGCHDAAVHFGTPFISGKDSLNNEYIGEDGKRRAIAGTLLISSISIVEDIRHCITMDLGQPGDLIYLVGEWQPALAGSHVRMLSNSFLSDPVLNMKTPCISNQAPLVYRKLHQAIQGSLINSAHDLSEGGLAAAAAEMSLAGRRGIRLELEGLHQDPRLALFAETNGCLLISIDPHKEDKVLETFTSLPKLKLGTVNSDQAFVITHSGDELIKLPVDLLANAFLQEGDTE